MLGEDARDHLPCVLCRVDRLLQGIDPVVERLLAADPRREMAGLLHPQLEPARDVRLRLPELLLADEVVAQARELAPDYAMAYVVESELEDQRNALGWIEDPARGLMLTERAARARGVDVVVGTFPFGVLGKAKAAGETDGFVKIVADRKYDELLGIHMIGLRSTELVAEATAALRFESTVEELIRTIHAHPTMSEAVGEAAHAAHGAAIHI